MWRFSHSKWRSKKGSQIAELPPALILLFLAVFFPLLNILYIFVAYCAGWYLNQIELRQVACQPPQNLTSPVTGSNNYTSSTYGGVTLPQSAAWHGFLGVVESEGSPSVTYLPLSTNPTVNQVGQAQVTTTVTVQPFLSQGPGHWLPSVPGLNEPLTFVYTNTILQEEQIP